MGGDSAGDGCRESLGEDGEVMDRISERSVKRGSCLAGERGSAMLEFAIIVPSLILFLFFIVEFALIMYDKAVITNASREGARLASLYYPDAGNPGARRPEGEIQSAVMDYASKYLITFGNDTLDLSDIQVVREQDASGIWVGKVIVTYHYDFMILPNLLQNITGPFILSAATIMRDENQIPPS